MTGRVRLARRTAHIAPFEVMEVLDLARRREAEGRDVIHLEVGEPDFPTPEPVTRAAIRALEEHPMLYTSAVGMPELREAIAAHYARDLGVEVDPGRVIVTTGSSGALLLALGMLVDAGDEVLMGDPCYPCNRHFASFIEARARLVPCGADTAYQVTADMLAREWTGDTRGVIAASPSNPTGTLIPLPEWERLGALCADRGAALVADEIYQGLTYGRPPETVLAVAPDALVVNSFSKYFQMTGWRIGWLVLPPHLAREAEKLAQNLFICPPAPSQHAALAAFLPETTAILQERRAELQRRRDALLEALPATGLRVPAVPEGAFYVYCDVAGVAESSFDLCRRLLLEADVALTPGRDFGLAEPERHLRIAYSQPVPRLVEACERIARVTGRG